MPDDALNEGLVAQLLRLERARDVLEVQKVVNHLMEALRAPQYLHLHRAFAVWLDRIVLKRTGITQRTHEFNDLQEVNSMLEERASQWREELIQKGVLLGEARGISIGEVRGISLAVRDTLEDRFGNIPPAVETFLAAITDSATLRNCSPWPIARNPCRHSWMDSGDTAINPNRSYSHKVPLSGRNLFSIPLPIS